MPAHRHQSFRNSSHSQSSPHTEANSNTTVLPRSLRTRSTKDLTVRTSLTEYVRASAIALLRYADLASINGKPNTDSSTSTRKAVNKLQKLNRQSLQTQSAPKVAEPEPAVATRKHVFLEHPSPPLRPPPWLVTSRPRSMPPLRPATPPTPTTPIRDLPCHYFDFDNQQCQSTYLASDNFAPPPLSYHPLPPSHFQPQYTNTDLLGPVYGFNAPMVHDHAQESVDSVCAGGYIVKEDENEWVEDKAAEETQPDMHDPHQLRHFHEFLPQISVAFAHKCSSSSPYHPLALVAPKSSASGNKLPFTHIVRILYEDEDDGLIVGQGWPERFYDGARTVDVLTLVVPRDDLDSSSPDTNEGLRPAARQTTLAPNQLLIARDFLSLAKPHQQQSDNPARKDFGHVLICAPQSDATQPPMDVFASSGPSYYVSSSGRASPEQQQRRNVLSLLSVYLAFTSKYSVPSVWAMLMFYLRGALNGIKLVATTSLAQGHPDDLKKAEWEESRDAVRLWMGIGVEEEENETELATDEVLRVEKMWAGWEVLKEAVEMDS